MKSLTLILSALALLVAGCGSGSGEDAAPSSPGTSPTTGAITIEEALRSDHDGPILVQGTLIAIDGEPVRLCSAILESYPPQCGEPSLIVEGLDLATVDRLASSAKDPEVTLAQWSESEIALRGTVAEGVLTVSTAAE